MKKYPFFVLFVSSWLTASANEPMPISNLWKSEQFRKAFTASYGVDATVEPRISPEEKKVLDSIAGKMEQADRKASILKLQESLWLKDSPALQFTLANLLVEEGRSELAIPYFKKAIELYPSFRDAYRNLALAQIQTDQPDTALVNLSKAIERGAIDGLTYGLLGYCHMQAERHAQALQAYGQAQLLMPDEGQWQVGEANTLLMLGENEAAAKRFGELLNRQPENDQLWLAQSDAYLAAGRYDEAVANRELVRRKGKLAANDLLVLGHLYLNIDLPDDALSCYEEAFPGITPDDALEALERLLTSKYWNEARKLAAQINSDSPKLRRMAAFIDIQSGKVKSGIQTLENIIAEDPMDAEALLMLGKAYRQKNEHEKSVMRLEQAVRHKTAEYEALLLLGQTLAEQGQYERAIKSLTRANRIRSTPVIEEYIDILKSIKSSN